MSNPRNTPSRTPRATGANHGSARPDASFIQVVGAVLSAFVGIRKRQAADRDIAIKPAHVVMAGVLAGLVFIAVIVTVVRLVVSR